MPDNVDDEQTKRITENIRTLKLAMLSQFSAIIDQQLVVFLTNPTITYPEFVRLCTAEIERVSDEAQAKDDATQVPSIPNNLSN